MTHAALSDAAQAAARPLELAIVLPTLNEKANIAPMVARLEEALGPSAGGHECSRPMLLRRLRLASTRPITARPRIRSRLSTRPLAFG